MLYSLISSHSFSKKALTRSPVTNGNSTPKRFFKRSFRHPSLAKRIIARRHGSAKLLGYVKKVLEMSSNRAITTVVLSQHYR
ncbi:hypothetical protein Bca52824_047881 [Brassica carinata]|uniref:Uncharacterized protein n=1 Tax=Brassica carinata TaxID=52824 RepID=A0A8X7RHW8_BRACI|nr:hypothetical protein Bca52824_047881 [Brassica carinata]